MATPRSTLAVSWFAILICGLLSGALGPLLPELSTRAGVSVEALGSLFTAFFLGALTLQFAGGWLNERLGLRTMVLAGTALLVAGIAGLSVSHQLWLLLACACLAGTGQGALDVGTNVLVAAVHEERRVVSAVNFLHFAFGLGAVASPLLAAHAAQRWGTPMPLLWLAVMAGLLTLAAATRALLDPPVAPHASARAVRGFYRRLDLWALAALMFLYVGVEMGLGGWTTVYLGRTTTLPVPSIAWVVSGYWMALTAGRLLGVVLGSRLSARGLTAVSLAGSALGGLVLASSGGSVALAVTGTLLCGLSFGPIFPTVVVLATERFRDSPSRAVSLIIAMSSLGGMALLPLQGVLLARVSPFASVAQVALCNVLMLATLRLALAVRRPATPREAPRATG